MNYPLTHRQFYEGLKKGILLGLRCFSCGAYTAPPKICCAECGGTNLEVVKLSGHGQIKTFTVIRISHEEFTAPYIVALAELDEGPWLMGNLEGIDIDHEPMDFIGKKVNIGYKVIPSIRYSAGEGVAVTFYLK